MYISSDSSILITTAQGPFKVYWNYCVESSTLESVHNSVLPSTGPSNFLNQIRTLSALKYWQMSSSKSFMRSGNATMIDRLSIFTCLSVGADPVRLSHWNWLGAMWTLRGKYLWKQTPRGAVSDGSDESKSKRDSAATKGFAGPIQRCNEPQQVCFPWT